MRRAAGRPKDHRRADELERLWPPFDHGSRSARKRRGHRNSRFSALRQCS
jgi:hypothetical protein